MSSMRHEKSRNVCAYGTISSHRKDSMSHLKPSFRGKKIQKAKFWVILQFYPYPLLLFISYNYICSFTKIPIGTAEIAQACIQILYLPSTSWVTLSKLPNLSESQFFFPKSKVTKTSLWSTVRVRDSMCKMPPQVTYTK